MGVQQLGVLMEMPKQKVSRGGTAWSKVGNTRWQDIRPRSGLEVAPPKEGALKIYLVNFRSLTHLPVEGFGFEP